MNWHNHAGIATLPMQLAVKFGIPLVFWGEHGWTDLGGMHSMHDFVEYTARFRKDQQMRGMTGMTWLVEKMNLLPSKKWKYSNIPLMKKFLKLI